MARRAALLALSVVVIAATAIVLTRSNDDHVLRAVFQSALQVVPGQQVRIAGRTVGSVKSVALNHGEAVVAMNLGNQAWPLHRGTTAELRFGSAAGYATRFVQLDPGPGSAPALPDNGILSTADTVTPVEFDQIYDIFNQPTRQNLAGLLDNAAQTLSGQGGDLRRDLVESPSGLERTAGFEGDLGSDPNALGTLVDSAAATTHALASRDDELGQLANGAATTFQALAVNAGAQQATLDRLPAALAAGDHTLAHLDRSLGPLNSLVDALRPGAAGLLEVAAPLRRTLGTLRQIAPLATSTLRNGTRDVPALRKFLSTATPFVPTVSTALSKLAPMVSCIRPYTPELAGFASTWAGFTANYDGEGHYARILVQEAPIVPGAKFDSAQIVNAGHGAISYAMPRPPGLNAGQPWYQPQCGAGPDALNPNDDPESKR